MSRPHAGSQSPTLGVAYFGNRYVHHARADFAEIAAMGATYVVHAMSEADLRWNPDTLTELVAAGRELGLSAWMTPWALGGVFGGEASSYAVMEHPEACQRDSEGNHLPALCPRQPAFRALIGNWLDAVAATGAEVCQWDEPHLARHWRPDDPRWACRCDICRDGFRDEIGRDMPTAWDPDVAAFTGKFLDATIRWLVAEANWRGLQSSIVLLPDIQAGTDNWPTLAALPGIRFFGGTPYWVFEGLPPDDMSDYLTTWCQHLLAATAGTDAAPLGWIQGFGIPAGRETEIELGVEIMRQAGVASIAVWAYRACEAMSSLKPGNPELVWSTIQRAFARTREFAS
ncbi:MAG: hypothetical protein ACJ789_16960 [Thermomicrobiales bacterium]